MEARPTPLSLILERINGSNWENRPCYREMHYGVSHRWDSIRVEELLKSLESRLMQIQTAENFQRVIEPGLSTKKTADLKLFSRSQSARTLHLGKEDVLNQFWLWSKFSHQKHVLPKMFRFLILLSLIVAVSQERAPAELKRATNSHFNLNIVTLRPTIMRLEFDIWILY